MTLRPIYIGALMLMLSSLAHISLGQSRAIQALNKGRAALEAGDYSTAEQELEYCKRLNPTTPYVYAFLAKAYYYQSELDRAIYAYNKSLETDYQERANGMVELVYQNSVSLKLEEQQALNPAVMYYQKGRLHHLKGNDRMASRDMEKSLTINPYFEDAKLYLDHIRSGQGPLLIEAPITSQDISNTNAKGERRPISVLEEDGDETDFREIRKARNIYYRVEKARGRTEKKFLEKQGERKFKQGKTLPEPKIGYKTQNYIDIESIIFTSNQTIVNFVIENPSDDSAYVLRLDQDLLITERKGGRAKSYSMARIRDFKRNGTVLKAGGKLRFSVTFPDIPTTINYINIIEGSRSDGKEWNFYDIQLFE
ncbi:MAG: hypothetical protein MRZ79_08570 [Bacteroidia bacterium]|nr:hypothetical protein [Bacteroidia bacterium]